MDGRLPASLGLALGLVLLPASTLGQAPPEDPAPLRDSVVAQGHVLLTDFAGRGEAGPNGEDPVGSLTLSGFLTFTTETTCLNVSGNAVVSGGRIATGDYTGRGFLSSSVDNGPPVDGRPVDVTRYSGLLPSPPASCPMPGDPPPRELTHTGGGPFTSGDLTVVDAVERLPVDAPSATVEVVASPARRRPGLRVRVCGAPGVALMRVAVRRARPRETRRPQRSRCQVHRLGVPAGERGPIALRARTTGRRWSRAATR